MKTSSSLVLSRVVLAALPLLSLAAAGRAQAAPLVVVTPGEQNTKSGENGCGTAPCAPGGCAAMTCAAGHWFHYPEILSNMLGSGYVVNNTGDGGAILGCDAASMTLAGGNSFCASGQYKNFTTPAPDIVIIGPFGEHDQRILAGNAMFNTFYTVAAFQSAYEGLILKYQALKPSVKIFMMTPIDVMFNAGALPAGKNIVKDVMLAASKAAAQAHNVPIIDTYSMVTMADYATDGQVNAAAQMKMATLILDAIKAGGGADGGAGGSTGADGGADAAGGATGTAGAGAAGATGAAGSTTGAAGSTLTGAAGSTTGAAGSTSGAAGSTTGAAGSTSGAAGSTAGAAGASSGTGVAGTGGSPQRSSGGGCAVAAPTSSVEGALGFGAAGLLLALAFGRRRRR